MLTIEMTKKMIAPDQSVFEDNKTCYYQHPVLVFKILSAGLSTGRPDVHF
jgi:hypothetical protein